MLFSLNWLLELCPVAENPRRLADALTARGLTVDALESRPDDTVLDVDVPANRPDCLGHIGLARELAAAFGVPLSPPRPESEALGDPVAGRVSVDIEDPARCARYTARLVRDVRIGPSPARVVRRLEACGLRSVNNAVDASNLVLLELGNPIHFFDFARLSGGDDDVKHVRVRNARNGERLTTLDGVEHELDAEILVIADDARAVALAGVMGGADSEISDGTRDILIEAAHFEPRAIRAASRRLGLQTEASYRFARGVDPQGLPAAQRLAVRLLAELAAGKPAPGCVDAYPAPRPPRRLTLRAGQLTRLLGLRPSDEEVRATLRALGMTAELESEGRLRVGLPSFRSDLEREADLVEEVARHAGYDRIPTAAVIGGTASGAPRLLEEHAREVLAHLGFHEALGYSMIAEDEDADFVAADSPAPLRLANPIAEPLGWMRRSIVPGLLRSASRNLRRGNRDVRLFEVGRVFLAREAGEFPVEPLHAGIAWSGAGAPRHWSTPDRSVDLYDVIGVVERLLLSLRPDLRWTRAAGGPAAFHPGRSACWRLDDGREIAWSGELHPKLQETIEHPLTLAELNLDALAGSVRHVVQHASVARLPAVSRDLSLLLGAEVSYDAVLAVLRSVSPPAPVHFQVIDRYAGERIATDRTSITVRLLLQPEDKTLTDPQTETYRAEVVRRLEQELSVQIRDS